MRNRSLLLLSSIAALVLFAGCGSDPAKTPKAAARDGSASAQPAPGAGAAAPGAKGDSSSPTRREPLSPVRATDIDAKLS